MICEIHGCPMFEPPGYRPHAYYTCLACELDELDERTTELEGMIKTLQDRIDVLCKALLKIDARRYEAIK
jgi:hypothetical protein